MPRLHPFDCCQICGASIGVMGRLWQALRIRIHICPVPPSPRATAPDSCRPRPTPGIHVHAPFARSVIVDIVPEGRVPEGYDGGKSMLSWDEARQLRDQLNRVLGMIEDRFLEIDISAALRERGAA